MKNDNKVMRFVGLSNEEVNRRLINSPSGGTFFQSPDFLDVKKDQGWKVRFVESSNGQIATVLERFHIWYILKGPCVANFDELAQFVKELRTFAKKQHIIFIKMEPELIRSDELIHKMASVGLRKTVDIQPNVNTIIVDLQPDENKILASFDQKGRNAIHRAEREGVKIVQGSSKQDMEKMYELLSITSHSAGFGLKHRDYYFQYWKQLCDAGYGRFFFSEYDGEIVAGAFEVMFGHKSTYKDGGSLRDKTVYGASQLLQWEAMKWAKKLGSKSHDLCGSPDGNHLKDKSNPLYGIGLFKSQFNKEVTEYVGTFDLPINRFIYFIWHIGGEKLIRKIYYIIHHQSFY